MSEENPYLKKVADRAEEKYQQTGYRRDFNAYEQHLIRQGKEAEAKQAWHKRTGK